MTRVIAGQAGGRRLAVPPGTTTRPTSDRALDLYAGSGAIGLEALSRGAGRVLLVESDARAASVIKANVKTVDLPGATVAVDRVERLLARPPAGGQNHDRDPDRDPDRDRFD